MTPLTVNYEEKKGRRSLGSPSPFSAPLASLPTDHRQRGGLCPADKVIETKAVVVLVHRIAVGFTDLSPIEEPPSATSSVRNSHE